MPEIIPKNTEKSYGGICKEVIEVIGANSGIPFPDIVRNSYIEPLLLIGIEFEDLFSVRNTVQFVENEIEENGATIYEGIITAIVANDSAERVHALQRLSRKQWIVKFTDQNGITKLMGGNRSGASFSFGRDWKQRINERKEIPIQFKIKSRFPVPEYPF